MGTSIIPVPWKSINGTRGISKAVTLDEHIAQLTPRLLKA